jgi:prevent-host-death family protein
MKTVSAYEAKTHFSSLLAEAEKGEKIIITKHGVAAAVLAPLHRHSSMSTEEAIKGILRLGSKTTLKGIPLKDLIEEGRK